MSLTAISSLESGRRKIFLNSTYIIIIIIIKTLFTHSTISQ